ncbi:alpha-amylase family glycosyl hydrolase [Sinomonas sp. ASV322]|uniref:alpha-amylase family glycosyl hydrolase n=1 Tax=Sinomonas sp. ASV322 TaxID=3041920 RepID=UPI0027DD745E|nr:alpha-amylase family glycosyl hydrolase [Sinomonas sp. ASV322]MDQ4501915.1 alpha-amylase family glycosyl hydrolase [Sinomonas sp. ASV322]
MLVPSSTYRLQIRPGFTLDDAAGLVPYLHRLGAGWLYLSPILTAVRGSEHGYDVADPTRVDPDRGGREGLERLSAAAHALGMGVLVDIVPNHVGIAVPEQNAWWWSLLAEGRDSAWAEAFDVDWDAGDGRVLLPLLASDDDLDRLRVEGDRLLLGDLALPIATGSAAPGDSPREVAARQHYALIPWREGDERLNYRRFFTVKSLAGLRVEDPSIFEAAHAEIARWFKEGLVDGLRIDHPDGLADPIGYLERLRGVTGGAYTIVEKILEADEQLPDAFSCEGTTGYDALGLVDRLFTDPEGEAVLDTLDASLGPAAGAERAEGGEPAAGRGTRAARDRFTELARGTRRQIAAQDLRAEILRLARLVPAAHAATASLASPAVLGAGAGPTSSSGVTSAPLGGRSELPAALAEPQTTAEALAEIAAAFSIYRTYLPEVPEGIAVIREACDDAAKERPDLADTIAALEPLLADPHTELSRRFQQTTGMIMAKGVEDTAFYRFTRLGTLTEVGTDPARFAIGLDEFHARTGERERKAPHSMTTLTTHDTKRSEDTRARISVLSELADEWAELLPRLLGRFPLEDGQFANLVWQAVVGSWPADAERLAAYAIKAARESALHTTWTDPEPGFEARVRAIAEAAASDPAVHDLVGGFVARIEPFAASNGLSAKLVQLAGPGVPDVYQGAEFWDRSLADPDNRRPVDFAAREAALEALDAGAPVPSPTSPEAKLLVVSRTLRLRRDRPELFDGYVPLDAVGPASRHAVGFRRGARGAVALATRLPAGLERGGGWGDTGVVLPWPTRDELTGAEHEAGRVHLADAFAALPVALLVPEATP